MVLITSYFINQNDLYSNEKGYIYFNKKKLEQGDEALVKPKRGHHVKKFWNHCCAIMVSKYTSVSTVHGFSTDIIIV
jgi:hypothetical protein